MVKISFQQPAAAGLKPEKEAAAASYGAKAEILLPRDVEEQPLPVQNRRALSRLCYLTMILMLLFLGLILTSMYIYRYFSVTGSAPAYLENVFRCGVIYEDHSYSQLREQLELHEDVRIYLEEDYEQINVPMPHFGESDPADIIHDFQRKGAYLPQTYIIHEEMIVTEHVTDMEQLGSFIYHLCHGKETYKLKRRTSRRHIHRRAAKNCHHIRHFENTFVVDTAFCQKL
ncbi:integral membrane protein 2C isoform X2 [Hemicordylus capensis]|uniref:integral membrane protein 2C isoform X2 n=1 Tax=Hemicordylus capensis TaxID=884348 RepID=UPI00230201F4|nr:integral membrane protein 2C isoform X2 [Hemicordylus capensis]